MRKSLLAVLFFAQTTYLQNGVYVNHVDFFNPGKGLFNYEERIENVLGGKKGDRVEETLSLGNGGEVSVSYADGENSFLCFKNGKGHDIEVQETTDALNGHEEISVYVSSDRILTPKTKWVFLGTKNSREYSGSKIPFEMPKGMAIGYHILLKDPNTNDTKGDVAGFDVDFVRINHPCINGFLS